MSDLGPLAPAVLIGTHSPWLAPSIIVAVLIFIGGLVIAYVGYRLGSQDRKIENIGEVTTDTRVSIARIEGYMARSNGGGPNATQLPDLPPPVVIHADPGKIVVEKPSP